LLEDLQNDRGVGALGFSDEQVDVFGHDHISHDNKLISAANLFEDFEEKISSGLRVQKATSLVTAEGNEMKISGAVVSSEVGHIVMVRTGGGECCDE